MESEVKGVGISKKGKGQIHPVVCLYVGPGYDNPRYPGPRPWGNPSKSITWRMPETIIPIKAKRQGGP